MSWALVAIFGAVGAPARYLTDSFVQRRTRGRFPFGTLTVNVFGSFVLGLLTGLTLHHGLAPDWRIALGTGFCGTLTTWSTWSFESVRLVEDGALGLATRNVVGGLAAGLGSAALGLGLALL